MIVDVLFWSTYIALWLLVLSLFGAVFVLYRHLGMQLLNTREQRMNQGPPVGAPLQLTRLNDIDGQTIIVSGELPRRPLLLFLASTTCSPCAAARGPLADFAAATVSELETILVCRGATIDDVRQFTRELPRAVRIVPDLRWEIGSDLNVSSTPFALIADADLQVRGKGAPTTPEAFQWFREQLPIRGASTDSLDLAQGPSATA